MAAVFDYFFFTAVKEIYIRSSLWGYQLLTYWLYEVP